MYGIEEVVKIVNTKVRGKNVLIVTKDFLSFFVLFVITLLLLSCIMGGCVIVGLQIVESQSFARLKWCMLGAVVFMASMGVSFSISYISRFVDRLFSKHG